MSFSMAENGDTCWKILTSTSGKILMFKCSWQSIQRLMKCFSLIQIGAPDMSFTCKEASDPLSMNSMTSPSFDVGAQEGNRPLNTPKTWITCGLLPWRIMSTSRSKHELVLFVLVCTINCLLTNYFSTSKQKLSVTTYPSSKWSSLIATSQHHLRCLAL